MHSSKNGISCLFKIRLEQGLHLFNCLSQASHRSSEWEFVPIGIQR